MRNFQFDFRYVLNSIKAASATFTYSTPVCVRATRKNLHNFGSIVNLIFRATCNVCDGSSTNKTFHIESLLTGNGMQFLSLRSPPIPSPTTFPLFTLPVIPACSCSLGRVKKFCPAFNFLFIFPLTGDFFWPMSAVSN